MRKFLESNDHPLVIFNGLGKFCLTTTSWSDDHLLVVGLGGGEYESPLAWHLFSTPGNQANKPGNQAGQATNALVTDEVLGV